MLGKAYSGRDSYWKYRHVILVIVPNVAPWRATRSLNMVAPVEVTWSRSHHLIINTLVISPRTTGPCRYVFTSHRGETPALKLTEFVGFLVAGAGY